MSNETNLLVQKCLSSNGRDYLDQSLEPSGECRPCLKKCYWKQDNSLPKGCIDLHERGECLAWPQPMVSDTSTQSQSDMPQWGIVTIILSFIFIILVVVSLLLYIKRNHPRLKPFGALLQRMRIWFRKTRISREETGNSVAVSALQEEERATLAPESQSSTNGASTSRLQQMQPDPAVIRPEIPLTASNQPSSSSHGDNSGVTLSLTPPTIPDSSSLGNQDETPPEYRLLQAVAESRGLDSADAETLENQMNDGGSLPILGLNTKKT